MIVKDDPLGWAPMSARPDRRFPTRSLLSGRYEVKYVRRGVSLPAGRCCRFWNDFTWDGNCGGAILCNQQILDRVRSISIRDVRGLDVRYLTGCGGPTNKNTYLTLCLSWYATA